MRRRAAAHRRDRGRRRDRDPPASRRRRRHGACRSSAAAASMIGTAAHRRGGGSRDRARRRSRRGLGVAALFEIVVRERRAVAAFAQRLELARSSAALPRSCPIASARRRGCRSPSRDTARPRPPAGAAHALRRTRGSASAAAPRLTSAPTSRRRWPAPCERGDAILGAILGPRDQAEHVVRLRRVGRCCSAASLRAFGGGREIGHVEERDREIDAASVSPPRSPARGGSSSAACS